MRAVFLDALGTLVELEPPWEHLRQVVPDRIGDEQLVRAVRAEMAYYKEHAHEGRDEESLADLRRRCADLLSGELGVEVTVAELVDAVRMRAYPDAAPALEALRARGLATYVVSNWDCSLPQVLEHCGLDGYFDGVVSSATAGSRKPEPAIFERALEMAGVGPAQVVHVGDTPEEDAAGARAAGIAPLLIDRDGNGSGDISSLAEIVERLSVHYESLFNRSVAALIDNSAWLFAVIFLVALVPESTLEEQPNWAGILLVVLASAWFNYFAICEWRWGQTVGKRVMGIRVVRADGSDAGFGPASLRNLLRLVDFFGIGALMIAGTERKQRLGDKVAGTVVVRTHPAPAAALGGPPEELTGPRQGVAKEITWGAGRTVRALMAGLALSLFAAPLLVLPFDPDFSSLASILVGQALLAASLIGVCLWVARDPGRFDLGATLRRLGFRPFGFKAIGIMFLTLLVYYVGVAVFAALVLEPQQEDIGSELGLDEGTVGLVFAVFLIVVVAPLSEEAFFRGLVFAGLRNRLSLWPAALISGCVFGLIHAPSGITTVIPLAALGIAFAWLYERTGSLWPCVIAHALNNALALSVAS